MITTTDCINLAEYASGIIPFAVVAENVVAAQNPSTANVTLQIIDINDNTPRFTKEKYSVSVAYLEPETELVIVMATDEDQVSVNRL